MNDTAQQIRPTSAESIRQHLVDPELCHECLSCLPVCPNRAIEARGRRVAIDPALCTGCGDCVDECPSGAMDSWVSVPLGDAYSLEEQFAWDRLPLPRID